MSLTRLSSASIPVTTAWTQLTKLTSATPSTPVRLAAPTATAVTVTITSSGTTATVTATAHGLATGDRVTIANASLANYNGTFAIIVVDANTFTYVMPGTATSPAVGLAAKSLLVFSTNTPVGGLTVSSITQTGGVATVTTATAHGFVTNDHARIHGTSISDYNGVILVTSVPSPTTFTYTVLNNPASPADVERKRITLTVPQSLAKRAMIHALAANTADIQFGPDANGNYDLIPAGTMYLLNGAGDSFDLSAFYFQSTAASQTVTIAFI